jgi:hypothetical protein
LVSGHGSVINLAGDKIGPMVVAAPAGLYMTLGSRGFSSFPGSLMGVIAYFRQLFLDADHYRAASEKYAGNPLGHKRPDYDRALDGVLRAQRILLPANRLVEIERMAALARDLRRPAVLYGGREAYRAAEALRVNGVPVIVNLQWPERDKDEDPELKESLRTLEMRELAPSGPAVLAKSGVRFAFYSTEMDKPASMWTSLQKAIVAGLSKADALRALTLSAAEIYNIADRTGSIEPGKIANLVVTDGDLFQDRPRVKYVFVDGVKFEPAADTEAATKEESK